MLLFCMGLMLILNSYPPRSYGCLATWEAVSPTGHPQQKGAEFLLANSSSILVNRFHHP